ncbi:hypothetical protein DM02DRAFT_700470 [Periconia macrospinosa]|uniref:BTB domain-containing protein n=1 Tax=Periconia macrospinosa TaxID=97972 RepID=A0A2V1EC16_9PLEO|nr:hypothetical protein DM02DRAFT_700470 [Periconia macrospinosa]
MQRPDGFPFFSSGDVIIKSNLATSINQTMRLHSQLLMRHSTYFTRIIENEPKDTTASWHAFTLEDQNGKVGLIYQGRYDRESPLPSDAQPCSTPSRDGVKIKLEGEASEDTPEVVPNPFKSYVQVLALFYNIQISTLNTSIDNTLILSEQIAKISRELECVQLVRPPLAKVLTDYRHELFLAIKNDPIRWLKLGETLENKAIYAECLVHLVGAYPKLPWPSRVGAWASLSLELRQLIKKKNQAIEQLRTQIERDLLAVSLPYGNANRPLDPTQPDQRETWLVVAVFRDYLAQQINELDLDYNRNAVLDRGIFFRNLAKGAFEPLDGERVRKVCHGFMRAEWKDFSDDLHKLKEYAAKAASDLAINQLMIDPDTHEVGYLTCVKVTNEDFPWLVAQRTLGGSSSAE